METKTYKSPSGKEYQIEYFKNTMFGKIFPLWHMTIWERLGNKSRIDILEHPIVKGFWIFKPRARMRTAIKTAIRWWERTLEKGGE